MTVTLLVLVVLLAFLCGALAATWAHSFIILQRLSETERKGSQ